jgi:hypothetical protein
MHAIKVFFCAYMRCAAALRISRQDNVAVRAHGLHTTKILHAQVFKYVMLQTMVTIVDSSHFFALYTSKLSIRLHMTVDARSIYVAMSQTKTRCVSWPTALCL